MCSGCGAVQFGSVVVLVVMVLSCSCSASCAGCEGFGEFQSRGGCRGISWAVCVGCCEVANRAQINCYIIRP